MRSYLVRILCAGSLYHIPLMAYSAEEAEAEALVRFPAASVAAALSCEDEA